MANRTKFKIQFQANNINNIVGKTIYIREIGTFWDPLFFQTYNSLPSDIKENETVLNYVSVRRKMDEAQEKMSLEIGSKLKDTELTNEKGDKAMISDYVRIRNIYMLIYGPLGVCPVFVSYLTLNR